jgi:hypothetical protein
MQAKPAPTLRQDTMNTVKILRGRCSQYMLEFGHSYGNIEDMMYIVDVKNVLFPHFSFMNIQRKKKKDSYGDAHNHIVDNFIAPKITLHTRLPQNSSLPFSPAIKFTPPHLCMLLTSIYNNLNGVDTFFKTIRLRQTHVPHAICQKLSYCRSCPHLEPQVDNLNTDTLNAKMYKLILHIHNFKI